MHPVKYLWAMRALIYRPIFKHIGFMSYIGKPCFIEGAKRIHIGSKTRIFPGIRMEAHGNGKISIGDNCAIEQNVHLTAADNALVIEDNVTILANSFITNINHNYENISCSVLEQGFNVKNTRIGEGCFIGHGAAIQAGTILGKHCIVGTNSVVKGEFPDYCVIVGAPAKIIKVYNKDSEKWERFENGDD
ncbi:MAG TPA: acyltransferase [Candidatus Enterococcus stercoripullorum]|nr:acyltransferase [Candidatus Enterococcus stercoripullorum]